MQQFFVMMSQIFFISCIQLILEVFLADKKHAYMVRIITVACYLGSLYIIIQFTSNYLLKALTGIFIY